MNVFAACFLAVLLANATCFVTVQAFVRWKLRRIMRSVPPMPGLAGSYSPMDNPPKITGGPAPQWLCTTCFRDKRYPVTAPLDLCDACRAEVAS